MRENQYNNENNNFNNNKLNVLKQVDEVIKNNVEDNTCLIF